MKTQLVTLLTAATVLHFAAGVRAGDDRYVAHEWGTFTSVQGNDGVQLEWNPLSVSELPGFVYDRNKRADGTKLTTGAARYYGASKSAFMTLQRMETPVIYFYSDTPKTVDVAVKFPQGIHTEWYPQVYQNVKDDKDRNGTAGVGFQLLEWKNLEIVPTTSRDIAKDALPFDKSGSHYYAARETQSSMLRVKNGPKTEMEKFLFYRGIGNFTAPLTARPLGADGENVEIKNTGSDELRHFFVYYVRNGLGKAVPVDKLAPGETKSVKLQPDKNLIPLATLRTDTQKQLQAALVKEGLYDAEAWAMVRTWDDSWFAEQGMRVLYVLPRTFTDRTLPLTISPAPKEIVRVMVGRAELITTDMEWNLLKEVVRYSDPDAKVRASAVENVRKLGLGRFTEPAVRRLMKSAPMTKEMSSLSWELLQESSKTPVIGKPVALTLPQQ